jgi:hypothetical protein
MSLKFIDEIFFKNLPKITRNVRRLSIEWFLERFSSSINDSIDGHFVVDV